MLFRRKRSVIEDLPLLSTSSVVAKQRIAVKVEEMLGNDSGEEIPCTPAFSDQRLAMVSAAGRERMLPMQENAEKELTCVSTSLAEPPTLMSYQQAAMIEPCATSHLDSLPLLPAESDAGQKSSLDMEMKAVDGVKQSSSSAEKTAHASLAELGSTASLDYKTLWQLSGYCQEELLDQFFVPALQDILPPVVVSSGRGVPYFILPLSVHGRNEKMHVNSCIDVHIQIYNNHTSCLCMCVLCVCVCTSQCLLSSYLILHTEGTRTDKHFFFGSITKECKSSLSQYKAIYYTRMCLCCL